jgi:hypothetical protein
MKPVQLFDRDCAEKTLKEVMSMSVYCHAHPLTSLRAILRKQKGKRSAGAPCLGFDFGELELLMFF